MGDRYGDRGDRYGDRDRGDRGDRYDRGDRGDRHGDRGDRGDRDRGDRHRSSRRSRSRSRSRDRRDRSPKRSSNWDSSAPTPGMQMMTGMPGMMGGLPFGVGGSFAGQQGDVRPGDWQCPICRANVFASKPTCFKCNTPRPAGALTQPGSLIPEPTVVKEYRPGVGWVTIGGTAQVAEARDGAANDLLKRLRHEDESATDMTTVLNLSNLAQDSDLVHSRRGRTHAMQATDAAFAELTDDVKTEASKHGVVKSLAIPRPGNVPPAAEHIGQVFVEFSAREHSMKAQISLNGRKFAGQPIRAGYFDEEQYRAIQAAMEQPMQAVPPAPPAGALPPPPAMPQPGMPPPPPPM